MNDVAIAEGNDESCKLYQDYLDASIQAHRYRILPKTQAFNPLYLNFSTNDYLNLSNNPDIVDAALVAARKYGIGATGSRLLSGNAQLFVDFESQIAKDKSRPAALVFNSGFQANVSALSALLDKRVLRARPIVFFDRLNHASLYQAVFLAESELVRYRHNDIVHLEELMQSYSGVRRPKWIVTETIFGMDGDVVDLRGIVVLARKYGALLYLDEAHATGVCGVNGYGMSIEIPQDINCVTMGTFSKALGCSGGYIACSTLLRDYLLQKAHGFIYSTASSPMLIGAAYKAWQIAKDMHNERLHLQEMGVYLRHLLRKCGFDIGNSNTHIVPLILGCERKAMQMRDVLRKMGVLVSAVRPPTVPPGGARLRIALTAKHSKVCVERLVSGIMHVATLEC